MNRSSSAQQAQSNGAGADAFWDALRTYQKVSADMMALPQAAFTSSLRLTESLAQVVTGTSEISPAANDARFDRAQLESNPLYRRSVQSYLAWCGELDQWLDRSGLDGTNADRTRFMLRILKDVWAPQNTLLGNPAAMKKAVDTRGESLRQGFRNYLDDLRHNNGYPSVADRSALNLGVDLATTPGQVVFKNELFELIQYTPTTATVHSIPLLYVFSQINRFYLGDLTPDRSLIKALLDAGIQVFVVSWRNPNAEHRNWGLETYAQGVIDAIEVTRSIAATEQVDLIGVCAGGMTTAVAAAVLAGQGRDLIRSLSLFINVIDNQPEDSDFGAWISPTLAESQKLASRMLGYVPEAQIASMFNWLRPEENVMSFARNNYLMGEKPAQHPLLAWSMHSTRMPERLYSDYLDIAVNNSLVNGTFTALGIPVDLSRITCPIYMMAGSKDHITPWQGCYRSVHLFGSTPEFVLTNQGHTHTISARGDDPKLRYWLGSKLPERASDWLKNAKEHVGTWRDNWINWLESRSKERVSAPSAAGNNEYQPIGSAPGQYVQE